jgi:hypothetical protein
MNLSDIKAVFMFHKKETENFGKLFRTVCKYIRFAVLGSNLVFLGLVSLQQNKLAIEISFFYVGI